MDLFGVLAEDSDGVEGEPLLGEGEAPAEEEPQVEEESRGDSDRGEVNEGVE